MKVRILVISMAIASGLSGGYFLRAVRHAGSDVDGATGARAAVGDGARSVIADHSRSVEVGFQGEAQENADLYKSEGVTRWLHWAASLEMAGLDDMVRLSAFTKGDTTAREMLFSRWMELGPRHLFDTVTGDEGFSIPGRGELESMLIKEWSETDLDGLVEALRVDPKRLDLRWPREQIAAKLLERDAEAGLELHHEWGFVHRPQEGFNSGAVEEWARADPRHAIDFTMSQPSGELTAYVAGLIGKAWAQSDPEAALAYAEEEMGPGQERWLMAGAALKVWAAGDLVAAADWLGGAEPIAREKLSAVFVTVCAESDAAAALAWGIEHLQGRARNEAVVGAITKMVANDLHAATRTVNELEPSPARAIAAEVVAWQWVMNGGRPGVMSEEAATWMAGLDRTSLGRVLDRYARTWVRRDRDGIAEFLTRPETIGASQSALAPVAQSLVDHDPVAAMDWVERLPGQARAKAAARTAFGRWYRTQPEAAKAWLNRVPDSADGRNGLVRAASRQALDSLER